MSARLRQRSPRSMLRLGLLLVGSCLSPAAFAATTVWQVVAELEAALPLNEDKIARTLGIAVSKVEQGGNAVFRGGPLKVEDGKIIESLTFTPKRGSQAATVALKMPAAPARSENCLGRAEVSREYGAPVRNWTSQEGDVAFSHFEFARRRIKVSVAFSDVTNCLNVLTVEESR